MRKNGDITTPMLKWAKSSSTTSKHRHLRWVVPRVLQSACTILRRVHLFPIDYRTSLLQYLGGLSLNHRLWIEYLNLATTELLCRFRQVNISTSALLCGGLHRGRSVCRRELVSSMQLAGTLVGLPGAFGAHAEDHDFERC